VATISKCDETLVIELSALERSEAMHGDLEIPTAAISSVEVLDDAIHQIHGLRPSGLKITGTYLPARARRAPGWSRLPPGSCPASPALPGQQHSGGLAGSQVAATPPGVPADAGLFGRLFPKLPPFASVNPAVTAALMEVGQPGGILDAQDDLAAGPKALIIDPTVNGNPTSANSYGTNPDDPTMTAGSTFVGQFTDHDITFDQTSKLGVTQNPLTSPNARTPVLQPAGW
jgi:hypothetical protein